MSDNQKPLDPAAARALAEEVLAHTARKGDGDRLAHALLAALDREAALKRELGMCVCGHPQRDHFALSRDCMYTQDGCPCYGYKVFTLLDGEATP